MVAALRKRGCVNCQRSELVRDGLRMIFHCTSRYGKGGQPPHLSTGHTSHCSPSWVALGHPVLRDARRGFNTPVPRVLQARIMRTRLRHLATLLPHMDADVTPYAVWSRRPTGCSR